MYGLGVDNLLSIDLLLANYSIITASENQNKELFRAIRGSGGGTYGIALSMTVKLFDNPGKVSTFNGIFPLNNKTAETFGNWMINAPNQAWGYFIPQNFGFLKSYVLISANCFGNASFCSAVLSPLKTGCFWIPFISSCRPSLEKFQNFYEFFTAQISDRGGSSIYMASTVLNSNTIVAGLKDAVTFISNNKGTMCSSNAALGGVSSTIDLKQEKTSVALEMRQGLLGHTCVIVVSDSGSVADRLKQVSLLDNFSENNMKKYSKWVFWNEPQHNFPQNDWRERYWGGMSNYQRLLAVKQQYDPTNVFTCYHCIGYDENKFPDPAICPQNSCTCSNTPNGTCANTQKI